METQGFMITSAGDDIRWKAGPVHGHPNLFTVASAPALDPSIAARLVGSFARSSYRVLPWQSHTSQNVSTEMLAMGWSIAIV